MLSEHPHRCDEITNVSGKTGNIFCDDSQAQDEITTTVPDTEYAAQVNELVGFLLWLMEQREKLSKAIRRAKNALAFDIDGEVNLNKERQDLASTFRRMIDIKNSERLLSGGGRGYRFNAEGNQPSTWLLYTPIWCRPAAAWISRVKP